MICILPEPLWLCMVHILEGAGVEARHWLGGCCSGLGERWGGQMVAVQEVEGADSGHPWLEGRLQGLLMEGWMGEGRGAGWGVSPSHPVLRQLVSSQLCGNSVAAVPQPTERL